MKPKLKLVVNKGVKRKSFIFRKRPYTTYYFDSLPNMNEYTSMGFSATPKGAIRAAVVRVFMTEHQMAQVYHHDTLMFTIKPGQHGLSVRFDDRSFENRQNT